MDLCYILENIENITIFVLWQKYMMQNFDVDRLVPFPTPQKYFCGVICDLGHFFVSLIWPITRKRLICKV